MTSFRVDQFLTSLLVSTIALMVSSIVVAADETDQQKPSLQFFENHIRPLLHAKCVKCHGENKQEGRLRLDSLESLLKGGESGAAAVPKKTRQSLILEAVRYESLEMPPDKQLSAEEIAHLEKWIADGAAWPRHQGKSVRLHGAAFTKEEQNFWSLQPLTHPDPPEISADWIRNDVDRFVAAKQNAAGIEPAPTAEPHVLTRRLYFDLIGVPPELSDVAEAGSQHSNTIDRLLADPRYGEHWGRYWLDIVRYAESDGFRADFYRPEAWRYRDYVVNAFNDDKPYNQFITEQLAGDEVAPHKAEALVATGFLRTYLYEYNQRDARTQWQDILNQVTDVTGEAFLGIGVGCARCHDHKFDPILQEDYYRLQACFGTMIPRDDVPAADLSERERHSKAHQEWLAKGADIRAAIAKLRDPYLKKAAKSAIEKFPEDIQVIMAKAPEDRVPLEGQLADLVNRQILFEEERLKYSDADKKKLEALQKELAAVAGKKPAALPAAFTVADFGRTPQTLHIGADTTRRPVAAGGFSIINPAEFALEATKTSTGQRTALANWIASKDNPLTARVIVNRVWQKHFGTGLVETASDFGSLGDRPSHPELLDWLASEFIAHGWSIKWLHRQILNSATWQMSAFHPQAEIAQKADPGNRLRWRFDIQRLNAEQIRDAMLTASGELLSETGGPSVAHTSLRRSLYLKMLRNTPEILMRSLDGVDGLNSIPKRSTTTTPTQALNLMNGDWVRKRSVAMAKRILDESKSAEATTVAKRAFQVALGRKPDQAEISAVVGLISHSVQPGSKPAQPNEAESLTDETGAAVRVGKGALAPLSTAADLQIPAPFTFAGIIKLESLYPTANVRTIISNWTSNKKNRGWSIGVTSEKSAYQPRNFILQVVTDGGYEVVASNLRPELNKAYFAAVTVEQTNTEKGMAKFYLKPVNSKYGKLQTAQVAFKTTDGLSESLPVVLGGRTKDSAHQWDGQLDQMSLFDKVLNDEMLEVIFQDHLTAATVKKYSPTAFWDFEDGENPGNDMSDNQHNLRIKTSDSLTPLERAVAEVCHVLLNSNEFVYID